LTGAITAPGNNKIVDTSYGLQLGFGEFLVGGGYRKLDAEGAAEDGSAWGAGVTWTSAPVSVGVNYMESKTEGTTTNSAQDKFKQGMLVGSYNLGPGIDLIGAIFQVKYQDETSARANNNSGGGAAAGVVLRF
ncbi:MAG: porin, partial [Alphaproteobacteria bacterium]